LSGLRRGGGLANATEPREDTLPHRAEGLSDHGSAYVAKDTAETAHLGAKVAL